MRTIKAFAAGVFLVAAVYALTFGIERALMHSHVRPWFVFPLLATVPGCGVLFGLHLRWTAVALYVWNMALVCAAAIFGLGPESNLVRVADVAPAVVVAAVLFRIALRSAVVDEETV